MTQAYTRMSNFGVKDRVKKRKGKGVSVKMQMFPHSEHKHASFIISAVYAEIFA